MDTTLLLQTLNFIRPLSGGLQERFASCLVEETYPKRHILLSPGQTCRKVWFIVKGLTRAYHYTEKEKECTTWFMREGDLMISVYSFYTQQPSRETIEILEECTLQSITWTQLQAIYADFPEFNFIGRLVTEKYYIASEQRSMLLRNGTAIERYHLLLQQHPDIIHRVPLWVIASHLNVTHEALCRIRAKS
jgi:CRP-like cAMP-binding protein